jgi:CelD/BcsL family acetyltransferase involved in cellulose biosynthesis
MLQAHATTDRAGLMECEKEWEALLDESSNASIFMTFDYQYAGWTAFHGDDAKPLVITVRDPKGHLIGIAPFKTFRDHGSLGRWRTIEYLNSFEIDRPCPVVRKDFEIEFWQTLRRFVVEELAWDVLKLPELPAEHAPRVPQAFQSSGIRVEQSTGPVGIGIDLRGSWSEFLAQHRKFRKQMRRTEREHGDLEIERYEDPARILEGLAHYIDIERASWKAGKVGITKDPRHEAFYKDLLVRLAKRKRVTVRLLKTKGHFVAGEITYTLGRHVFFHHGAYDERYAAWSPGKYLSGVLLADYMGREYESGDYLSGFADYLRPWCNLEWKTVNTTIIRHSLRMRFSQLLTGARSYRLFGRRRSGVLSQE